MKKFFTGGTLNVLEQSDLERIHQASLTILKATGIRCDSQKIFDLFKRSGARVNDATRLIYVSPEMVEAALHSAPSSFVLYGRDPQMDLLLEPGPVYYGLGGTSEPFFWDYKTGRPRKPTKADMVTATRVGQALPNVDFIMALCMAGDTPPGQNFFHEYDAIYRNTTKPVVVSSLGEQAVSTFIEMAAVVSGGESALRERPWVIVYVTPVSPLQVSKLNEGMFEAAKYGLPIQYSPGPMMGASAPATVAGVLAQSSAETLFGLVTSQLIQPGTPFIYAPHVPAMDMSSGQCTYASADQALGRAAVAQLGRFYNLPTFNTGAGVDAKLPDAAAAGEAMMGMLLNGLAGMTLTQTMGTLASGLYGSVEMLVICDELAHMVKHILKGIQVTDDTLALEVLDQVGHGGTFLTHEHTLTHFRQNLFFPSLFKRVTIDQWLNSGARPIVDVAHQRLEEILSKSQPLPLPAGADQELERILSIQAPKIQMDL